MFALSDVSFPLVLVKMVAERGLLLHAKGSLWSYGFHHREDTRGELMTVPK